MAAACIMGSGFEVDEQAQARLAEATGRTLHECGLALSAHGGNPDAAAAYLLTTPGGLAGVTTRKRSAADPANIAPQAETMPSASVCEANKRPKKQQTLLAAFGKKDPSPTGAGAAATLTAQATPQAAVAVQSSETTLAARANPELRAEWVPRLGEGWFNAMAGELFRPSIAHIVRDAEEARRRDGVVYPPAEMVFRAFQETPFEQVRVVIVGQDPYHQPGQAMGLSFSVPRGVVIPPSLINMLKEAGCWPAPHGDLTSWAQQGVFLLNSGLTVIKDKPLSHKHLGWDRFTDAAIRALSRERKGVIFLLWGNEAKTKAKLVDASSHTLLTAGHPSPLSCEKYYKGCGHFTKVNEHFRRLGQTEIVWSLSQ